MINILSKWRTGRILLRKKTGFLNKVGYFVFDGMASIDAQFKVGIF
jgi:hypothetical protein